jgi:hypothetical protein
MEGERGGHPERIELKNDSKESEGGKKKRERTTLYYRSLFASISTIAIEGGKSPISEKKKRKGRGKTQYAEQNKPKAAHLNTRGDGGTETLRKTASEIKKSPTNKKRKIRSQSASIIPQTQLPRDRERERERATLQNR